MKMALIFLLFVVAVICAFVIASIVGLALATFDTACAAFDDSLKSGEFD